VNDDDALCIKVLQKVSRQKWKSSSDVFRHALWNGPTKVEPTSQFLIDHPLTTITPVNCHNFANTSSTLVYLISTDTLVTKVMKVSGTARPGQNQFVEELGTAGTRGYCDMQALQTEVIKFSAPCAGCSGCYW
jgi:hypothetical protein